MCQVWWKSTQGFLRFRGNEVKIAYLDQVHWPMALGGSRPKSNQFIYSSWCTPGPSMGFLRFRGNEFPVRTNGRTDGRTTRKQNASGALTGRRHNKPKHKNVWSPPEHFATGYVHNDNLPLGNIALQYMSFKTIGRSDGVFWWFPALSEDQEKKFLNSPKLSCGFKVLSDHQSKI